MNPPSERHDDAIGFDLHDGGYVFDNRERSQGQVFFYTIDLTLTGNDILSYTRYREALFTAFPLSPKIRQLPEDFFLVVLPLASYNSTNSVPCCRFDGSISSSEVRNGTLHPAREWWEVSVQ